MNKLRKKFRRALHRKDGFTLVEAVVAVFLLSVGLLSAASVLISVTGHSKLSSILTTATNLAEDKIENLRTIQYSTIASSSEDFGEITDNISFRRNVVVTPNAENTLKTVEVTVSHLGGQSVKLQTLIAR